MQHSQAQLLRRGLIPLHPTFTNTAKKDMPNTLQLLLLLGALSQLMVGCGTLETSSRKAGGVNLLQYHTFDFAEAKHPSDLRFFTPTNEARVKAAIRTELEKRGLYLAEPP